MLSGRDDPIFYYLHTLGLADSGLYRPYTIEILKLKGGQYWLHGR